jgi:hypothetical protein
MLGYFLLWFSWGGRSMLGQPDVPPNPAFKSTKFYLSATILISAMVVGWILVARWVENRGIEKRAEQVRTEKQQEQDRATLDRLGGRDLAILAFYAIPGEVRRGQAVEICYSVANAKSVKLEPQESPVWPSYSRCVNVTPTKTTTYTLTIADASGNTKTQTLEVKLR